MNKKNLKKVLNAVLATGMVLPTMTSPIHVFAEGTTNPVFDEATKNSSNDTAKEQAQSETPMNTNLALNKPVKASAEFSTMPAKNLTDADEESRWSTEVAPPQWAYIDLGQSYSMNTFSAIFEKEDVYASDYKIYVSDDVNNFGKPVVERSGNKKVKVVEVLKDPVQGRYVKLEVTGMHGYQSVSCRDFKVMLTDGELQDPMENVARDTVATASSIEVESVKASNAFDGNVSSKNSRWGSNVGDGPHWIYTDLGKTLDVKTVKVFWETRKATDYQIDVASENPEKEESWKTVYSNKDRPSTKNERIVLKDVQKARYVRLKINDFTSKDPDSDGNYNSISIYEMEVYGGEIKEDSSEIGNKISVEKVQKGDKKLKVNIPNSEDYEITYNGTDYEQVVDKDLTIYQPIVDTEVKVSFKLVDKKTQEYSFKEIPVTVPGQYEVTEKDNKAPLVLPELREWKGMQGNYELTSSSRVIYASADLKETAEIFAKDYLDMTGKKLTVISGTKEDAKKGDIFFALTKDTSKGLMEEGNLITIDDAVTVEAYTQTGAFWGTRTILQALKQGDNTSIAKGITRDYPLYPVRGFILDVGRKTFTMDYLEQLTKEMSWYKMNDLQIHLNDNLIPLEDYTNKGKDPMQAYSGFRLESNIKKGGNNGLNKADLTSTDVFYTKEEFRNYIQESRTYGVNIVPEIDTPAHSLALTKVRPDLRHGTSGRQNDHLNLTSKYDQSLEFVKSIFAEYMTGTNPVFDEQTTVHVGADEYSADGNAYRKFCNDMLAYVQNSGRTARIWGSLTSIKGDVDVTSKDVQMNLWNFGWANMDQMYEEGFDLINCNDAHYYIVPAAGYYYDYLNNDIMYNLAINSVGGVTIPAGDEQMIGGAFAVWNDMTDYLNNGISEYDVYDRIEQGLPLFAAKLWGKGVYSQEQAQNVSDQLGDAPNTNFAYEVEKDKDGVILHETFNDVSKAKNATKETVDGKEALKLNGSESYVLTNEKTAGLGNDLRVKVKRTSTSTNEQVLFESEYGSIKAVQKNTGKVGFSRENYDYSFNYELPLDEWVELEFKNTKDRTDLYVNGKLVDSINPKEDKTSNELADLTGNYKPLHATTMLPITTIGSKTNAFVGYVDDIRVGTDATFASTMELDYACITANQLLKENDAFADLLKEAEKVLAKYNPTQEEINTLTQKIQKEISATEYKKADYTRVDEYLALINEEYLEIYTEESRKELEIVVAGIRRDLPVSMQSTVDGYATQLARAIANLELKAQVNVNYIDSTNIKATASSYQKDGSSPDKVLDGDTSTMWHTDWTITDMPHWITLDMQEEKFINGLTYVPRQSGSNGNVTKYEIYVRNTEPTGTEVSEATGWKKIQAGTLKNDSTEKVIEFDEIKTRYVSLKYIEAVGNNGSAAEIKLHNARAVPDTAGLEAVIEDAQKVQADKYTAASYAVLQEKLNNAKELLKQTEINANAAEIAKRELIDAMVRLVLKVDTSALKELVEQSEALLEEDYTSASWANFKEALDLAKEVLAKSEVSEAELEEAYLRLLNAQSDLVAIYTKDSLASLINQAKSYNQADYTEASWKKLKDALNNANVVYDDEYATLDEIKSAILTLESAISSLEKAEVPGIDEEPGNGSNNPTKPGQTQPGDVGTGDSTNTGLYASMLALSGFGAAILAVIKKKKALKD